MNISLPAITPETILKDVATLAEAKEIARGMRETALVVANTLGDDHPTAKSVSESYWSFVDEMAHKFAS